MPITVSIVEDERPARELLVQLIEKTPELQCLGAYPNAQIALQEIPKRPPDVVLMDLGLPRLSGVECVRLLKRKLPELKIVVVTKHEDPDNVFNALTAGADGYRLKSHLLGELSKAITEAHQGATPMSPEIATRVVDYFHQLGQVRSVTAQLTSREFEVLESLARGFLYKEIAEKLEISPQTVNDHIKSIYKKLHVHTRSQAIVKFLRR